ncbi:MAG: hypothetical protein QM705_15445 [Ancrocorticia sp.]
MTSSMDMFFIRNDLRIGGPFSQPGIPSGYSHIMIGGGFGAKGTVSIFCYNSTTGQGDTWYRTPSGEFALGTSTLVRKGCTLVIAANLTGDDNRDILFYEPAGGTIDIYRVDNPGTLTLVKTTTGVRNTWTSVSMGSFGSWGFHDLFFYDATNGHGEFYGSHGTGVLECVGSCPDLPKNCTQVACGNFGEGKNNDLLFYCPSLGEGTFYTVEEYAVRPLHKHTGWSTSLTLIYPIGVQGQKWTSLIFYNGTTGEVMLAETDQGKLGVQKNNKFMPKGWTTITYLDPEKGSPYTGLAQFMGYAAVPPQPLSRFEFFATDAQGGMSQYDSRTSPHPGYSHIVSGNFGTGNGTDIFCYSPIDGQGDIWSRADNGRVLWQSSTPLRKGCTLVAAPNLFGGANNDLVLYSPTDATIDVYRVEAPGKLTLSKTMTDMRKTWTGVATGKWWPGLADHYSQLFFYDADAGYGEFFVCRDDGGLQRGSKISTLRKGCTMVESGSFCDGPWSDIMLHDKIACEGAFYRVNGDTMTEVYAINNWRKNFTQIIAGKWSDSPYTDLAQYDPTTRELALRSLDGKGGITTLKTHNVPGNWTTLESASGFRGSPSPSKDHIVCYNRTMGSNVAVGVNATVPPGAPTPAPAPTPTPVPEPAPVPKELPKTGKLALFTMDDWGMLSKQTEITGLRQWTHMLHGSFSRGGYNKILNPDGDLFFYHSRTGEAETVKVGANGKLTTIGKFTGLPLYCTPAVFTYQKSSGGILLYNVKSGAHLYDASLGKMTFIKTILLSNLPDDHIIRGGFSPQPGSNEFLFNSRTFYANVADGVDIAMVKLSDNLELRVASRVTRASELAADEEMNTIIVAGRFVGNSYDDYISYGRTYGYVRVFRGGNDGDNWFDSYGLSSQPKYIWSDMIPVGLKSNGGFRESILAYSFGKQRAEIMEVEMNGTLKTVKRCDNIGSWETLAPMPSSITKRVAFYSRKG